MTSYKKKLIIFLKEFFSARYKNGNKFLYFSILINFSVIAYYNLSNDLIMSPDSVQFSGWADNLIKLDFNLPLYYSQYTLINPNYLYTIPIVIIALSKLFFGAEWQNAFVIFNLIIVFFSLILFSKSLLMLKVRPLVISLAIFFLTLSVDILLWPRYVLTETFYSFLIILSVYLIIKSIIKEKLDFSYFILIMILIYFTRPTSLPYIFIFVFFIALCKFKIVYSPKIVIFLLFSLCIVTPFILAAFYQLMEIYFSDNRKAIYLIYMVENGVIIHDRPETWIASPKSFIDLANLYIVRFLYFFSPYAKGFSIMHIILNSLQTFIPLFSISFWFFTGKENNSINKTIALILLLTITVAFFHSFTLIDYDWRYRSPVIIPLLIIFPISFEVFIRKNLLKSFKY